MKRRSLRVQLLVWTMSIAFALLFVTSLPAPAQAGKKVSEFGKYSGYSEEVYDGYLRTSTYVQVRDSTNLAVDIFQPTLDGVVTDEPLPVVWAHERYQRAYIKDGKIHHKLAKEPWLETLVKHGYVVAVVDARGSGASFGTRHGPFGPIESQDAFDIMDWFTQQTWCNGRIGMFGSSYLGTSQYMAASAEHPNLFAIFPDVALTDLYQFAYAGGVYKENFMEAWGGLTEYLDLNGRPVAPVDEDEDGLLLAEALEQHQTNGWVQNFFNSIPYRDSWDAGSNGVLWHLNSPISYIKNIEKKKVAIYHWSGWFDAWPRDQLVMFLNLKNPQRITIGPWCHQEGRQSPEYLIEHLRWYDYWLKGIDNGIMDEDPIFYGTIGAPRKELWQSATKWPLKDARSVNFYFAAGPSGSVGSINDGRLTTEPCDLGNDDYEVDYSTTSGTVTRWTNLCGSGFGYPDMSPNDEKGLTYTTDALPDALEVTGHPLVHMWIKSTEKDGDFFVYLEEVEPNGYSHYVTEGTLRASHRSLHQSDFEYIGLPYHRSYKKDISKLKKKEPVELVFDLHPTSNLFDKGNRIRVTVVCADADTYETPILDPAPVITLYRNEDMRSYIMLTIAGDIDDFSLWASGGI